VQDLDNVKSFLLSADPGCPEKGNNEFIVRNGTHMPVNQEHKINLSEATSDCNIT